MSIDYLDAPEGIKDWNKLTVPDDQVTAMVIGKLNNKISVAEMPADFGSRFNNLKRLHLWGIRGLRTLPELPTGLLELDVRECADLKILPKLPEMLEVLVIGGAKELKDLIVGRCGQNLRELMLTDCTELSEASIHQILTAAPRLEELDLSGSEQLTTVYQWPENLVRIELNRCSSLRTVPNEDEPDDDLPGSNWPEKLTRLGLRGASALKWLPSLPESIDYVDLAHAKSLEALPRKWGTPRTLFLYGSAIQTPPASEHGETDSENVARQTETYFEDIRLFGPGSVKRCKILVLGNGGAGKTCLSLCLTDRDPRDAEILGSTHGVQFWPWEINVEQEKGTSRVSSQIWDFGGQEIYHNTHRLFVGRGALFLVVWNPDQKPGTFPEKTPEGYQDEWRSLQYWFDYIANSCSPAAPRIALVCSHRNATSESLEKAWRSQLSSEHQARVEKCFYVNSIEESGDLNDLHDWIRRNAARLIQVEGTTVPSYWEVAQSMVQSWLESATLPSNQMLPEEFRAHLVNALECASNDKRYRKLKGVMNEQGAAFLSAERIERTLAFLTRIGWVFWRKDLFESRVIVGQQWALDGIYMILDRRRMVRNREGDPMLNAIFPSLSESEGRYTDDDLLAWSKLERGERAGANWASYSEEERNLILSYMVEVNLAFLLASGEDRWVDSDLYVSMEHLPQRDDAWLSRIVSEHNFPSDQSLPSTSMHKGDWHTLLRLFGRQFGREASYARDAIFLSNEEGQQILITYQPDRNGAGVSLGFGGRIRIQVSGEESNQRLKTLVAFVSRAIPGLSVESAESPHDLASSWDGNDGGGEPPQTRRVFVSYAWNPRPDQADLIDGGDVPLDYERPVNLLSEALRPFGKTIKFIWDKTDVTVGTDITEFMRDALKADRIVVVHSDKYWRSPYCLYEFDQAIWSCLEAREGLADRLKLVGLETSRVFELEDNRVAEYKKFWTSRKGRSPERMKSIGYPMAELKKIARDMFDVRLSRLHRFHELNLRWPSDEKGQLAVIDKVVEFIRPLPPTPTTRPK